MSQPNAATPLGASTATPSQAPSAATSPAASPHAADNAALIAALVAKARAAQKIAATWSQERLDEVVFAVGWSVYKDENIRVLARAAVDETGMGVYEDKLTKHKNKVMGVLRDIRGAKTVGLMEVDEKKGIHKYAKPVGVVGALAPVTNPTATPRVQRSFDPERGQRRHLRPSPQGQGRDEARLRVHEGGAAKRRSP